MFVNQDSVMLSRMSSRVAACVVDHEHRLPALAPQFQWPQCPGTVQIALKFEFVRETIAALESRTRSVRIDGYERVRLALRFNPAESAEDAASVSP